MLDGLVVHFENNSDMEVKVTQKKIIESICKGNTMKPDMGPNNNYNCHSVILHLS